MANPVVFGDSFPAVAYSFMQFVLDRTFRWKEGPANVGSDEEVLVLFRECLERVSRGTVAESRVALALTMDLYGAGIPRDASLPREAVISQLFDDCLEATRGRR